MRDEMQLDTGSSRQTEDARAFGGGGVDQQLVEHEPNAGLMSVRQAAERLGVCERTLWTITNRGELPCIRIRGRKLYALSDLTTYIAQQRSLGVHDYKGAA